MCSLGAKVLSRTRVEEYLGASLVVVVFLLFCPMAQSAATASDAPPFPFFAFCMDTHDSEERTPAQQAELLAELGYDGAGHLWLEGLEERLKTLDAHGLKLYQVYLRATVAPGERPYDPKLAETLPLLEGRGVQLVLLMTGMKPSDPAGDARAVEIVREVAGLAQKHGVTVVLYPHSGDWLERVEDALRIVKKADCSNVGVIFNLCHWLKVDDEKNLRPLLTAAMPHLRAVSIHGADRAAEIQAGTGNWIQPLGNGTFDIPGLLALLRELEYQGPIGLQCYGLKGDAANHLAESIAAWRDLNRQLVVSAQGGKKD